MSAEFNIGGGGSALELDVDAVFEQIVADFDDPQERVADLTTLRPFILGEQVATDGPAVLYGCAGGPNEGDTDGGNGGGHI